MRPLQQFHLMTLTLWPHQQECYATIEKFPVNSIRNLYFLWDKGHDFGSGLYSLQGKEALLISTASRPAPGPKQASCFLIGNAAGEQG